MPEVCEIKGLSLQMLYRDHDEPHLHIYRHNKELAVISLTCNIRRGKLEEDKFKAVKKWILEHKEELYKCWKQAQQGLKFGRIK